MNNYDDIINIKHHEPSSKHPRMSIYNRSAQFSPFAALTGYNECINESSDIVNNSSDINKYFEKYFNENINKKYDKIAIGDVNEKSFNSNNK